MSYLSFEQHVMKMQNTLQLLEEMSMYQGPGKPSVRKKPNRRKCTGNNCDWVEQDTVWQGVKDRKCRRCGKVERAILFGNEELKPGYRFEGSK